MTKTPDTEHPETGYTAQAFRALGTPTLVYIRPVKDEAGDQTFYVHAADGSALGAASSYEQAVAEARYNELEPVSLH